MDRRVEFVIEVMRKSLGQQLSLVTLSERVKLSPTRLRQLFKKETGKSPSRFRRELRLQHAEHLLTSTFLTVKEIAFLTGAKNVSGFTRGFKRRHHVSPSVFRTKEQAPSKRNGVADVE